MAINYSVRKKVNKNKGAEEELYYAVPKALQKAGQGVNEVQLARELADISSLTAGDVLSVLELLSGKVASHLKEGRTIHIRGLGTFFTGITSEGCATREECTADKVRVSRICFKADKELSNEVKHTKFISIELNEEKKQVKKK